MPKHQPILDAARHVSVRARTLGRIRAGRCTLNAGGRGAFLPRIRAGWNDWASAPKQIEAVRPCTTTVKRCKRHSDSRANGRTDDQGHRPPVRAEDTTRGRESQQERDADRDDQPDEHSLTHDHEYRPLDCRIASSAPKIMPSTPPPPPPEDAALSQILVQQRGHRPNMGAVHRGRARRGRIAIHLR